MKVYFVGAGPGDPGLLTVKAAELLKSCSFCIYAGSLVSPEVLALIPENARSYDSARLDLDEIVALMEEARRDDVDVIRLHTGDPSIYGAIAEQMTELDRLGIEYEVIPGVSSFQAAAAALRSELTRPEVSQTVILTRTSGRTPMPETESLQILGQSRATLCIFLSTGKIRKVAEELSEFYGSDCPAALVYRASWPDQTVIRSDLANIADKVEAAGFTKTAMIVVGRALGHDAAVSRLYDSRFSHEYRKGKGS